MDMRKYSGRGKTFGPKRGILWMNISNCCSEPGSNQSCKEVKKEHPKRLIKTLSKPSNSLAKEEREK